MILIGGIAVRPCTGALFVLILTWQMGIAMVGIAGAFAMALGTATVTTLVGWTSFGLRGGLLASAQAARFASVLAPTIELLAGLLIAVIAAGCCCARCNSVKNRIRIPDPRQVQPLRRTDRSACRAVFGLKCVAHVLGCPSAGAYTFQCSDKAAHLVVQKGTRPDMKMYLGPRKPLALFDPEFIQRFDRACGLANRRPEGREIMASDQHIRPGLHRIHVQRVIDPPDLAPVMGLGRAAHQDAEKVLPFRGGKPRVPVIIDPGGLYDGHGVRLEMIVQRLGQAERVPFLAQVTMRDLPKRMNARIRAPGGGNCVIAGLNA